MDGSCAVSTAVSIVRSSLYEKDAWGQRAGMLGGSGGLAFGDLAEDIQCGDAIGFGVGGKVEDVVVLLSR
jgi:hypothetical protein